jgi:hypothetical protein
MKHPTKKIDRERKKSFLLYRLLSVLLIILVTSISSSLAFPDSENLGFSVELREWLILEVSTPSEELRCEDASDCSISTTLDMKNSVTNIRVLLSVDKNQVVYLKVRALGDLIDPQGNIFPVSNVAWLSLGNGFVSGVLDKDQSQTMACWKGPGRHQGTVQYQYLKTPDKGKGYFQTITYCLTML